MKTIQAILHPTDFSKHAAAALEVACSLAQEHHARLIVLHVIPSHEPLTHFGKATGLELPEGARSELKFYREEMERKLRSVQPPVAADLSVEHILKEGEIGKAIVQTMEQAPCEMIVMGTRGKSAPNRATWGSVAEEVARSASCPVVTVQSPHR